MPEHDRPRHGTGLAGARLGSRRDRKCGGQRACAAQSAGQAGLDQGAFPHYVGSGDRRDHRFPEGSTLPLLEQYDAAGDLHLVAHTTPLNPTVRRDMGWRLAGAGSEHAWHGHRFSAGWASRGDLENQPALPDLVAEFVVDTVVGAGLPLPGPLGTAARGPQPTADPAFHRLPPPPQHGGRRGDSLWRMAVCETVMPLDRTPNDERGAHVNIAAAGDTRFRSMPEQYWPTCTCTTPSFLRSCHSLMAHRHPGPRLLLPHDASQDCSVPSGHTSWLTVGRCRIRPDALELGRFRSRALQKKEPRCARRES